LYYTFLKRLFGSWGEVATSQGPADG
jgi:hypothetical protein